MIKGKGRATARPWEIKNSWVVAVNEDEESGYEYIASCPREVGVANAELIVKAVNGWEALEAERDALKDALDKLGGALEKFLVISSGILAEHDNDISECATVTVSSYWLIKLGAAMKGDLK